MTSRSQPAVPTMPPFDVARTPFGPDMALVEASAGTGKTFNIAMSVVRLLLEGATPRERLVGSIGNILVVTFTNAATEELVTRIRDLLQLAQAVYSGAPVNEGSATVQLLRALADGREALARERIADARAAVDSLAVFTIHGFCKRVLEEFALESGTPFGAALVEDDSALLHDALSDWWRRTFYPDASLAAYAASQGWAPTVFLGDYRTWQRFPDAVLKPAEPLAPARARVTAAVKALAACWNAVTFRERAGAIKWNKGAPCGDPLALDDLVARVSAAEAGDLAAAQAVASAMSVAALQDKANRQSHAAKAARAAIADWPEAQAATALAGALDALLQALRVECLTHTRTWLTSEKARRNLLGFDDLLASLSRVLRRQGADGPLARAIRGQFHAALIDEFQDTDRDQFAIFELAFTDRPLFLIGDPKQAIYAFRGADVHAYLGAATRAPHRYTLDFNYRSTPVMVDAVNALFMRPRQPFLEAAIGFHPASARTYEAPPARLAGTHALHWYLVPPDDRGKGPIPTSRRTAETLLFTACANALAQQIDDGWAPGRLAVLVRTTREGLAMARVLLDAGIPAVVSGLGDVMQSTEMHELQVVLEAIASPRHPARLRGALATHLWGCTQADLVRLASPDAEREWEALVDEVDGLRDLWVAHGPLQMLQALFTRRRVTERLLAYADGDRRMTNLRHAVELLHAAASGDQLNVEGVLRWVATQRQAREERPVTELRLETDADAVQIVTVHKSKGLEYDIVYCPTLWTSFVDTDGEAVLVHDGDAVVFDHGSPEHTRRAKLADVERLAEECRLVYVALTRARYRTYVGWGPIGSKGRAGAWDSGLSYLLFDGDLSAVALEEVPATVAAALEADCTAWRPRLEALVAAHPDLMHAEVLSSALPSALRIPSRRTAPVALAARTLPADIPDRERFDTFAVASFTSLTSAMGGFIVPDAARDVDDVLSVPVRSVRELPAQDFRTFPAGRRPGTVLHALFEESRFDEAPDLRRERVVRHLVREQLARDADDPRIDSVCDMMARVLATPMAPWSLALGQVAPSRVRHEWEFLLPFGDADRAVTRHALARCFDRFGGGAGVRYAAAVRHLGAARLHGFLTGFVDVIVEHEGRWYVADWKSNQLGADPEAYGREALQRVMDAHHYTLQYHLYVVALHRFLRQRVPGYDYDQHMGGAAYAFLRGFGPGASVTGHGWFTDRPPRALIDALSALMDPTPFARTVA